MRHRECDSPEPQLGGLSCIEAGQGPEDETVSCDMGPCPGKSEHILPQNPLQFPSQYWSF